MEKLTPESGSIEPRKIRFGRIDVATDSATEIKEMPFPTQRVLHWKPLFRNPDNDTPPPVRILISQEVLVAVNNHVAQSLDTEIGGFLLGNRYCDTSSGVNFVIIDQYVEALFTESTSVSLSFTMDAWRRLKEDLSGKFIGKALVGWYHSHPRMDVFLSDFDLHIHEERFKEPWMMALVIEPEKWLGGFFVWRDGKVNSRNPVEFYEYLPGEVGRIKETGSPWVNYICYNDATGLEQKVPRMQNALPVIGESLLDNRPSNWLDRALDSFKMFLPKSLQKFAFAIVLGLVILLSIGIAFTYKLISSKPTPAAPAAPASPAELSLTEQVFNVLDLIERDPSVPDAPELKISQNTKAEAKKGQEVFSLSNDVEITLYAKKIPDRGVQKAKLLLEKNIDTIVINKDIARGRYEPWGPDLRIKLTASMPILMRQLQESNTAPPLEVVFRCKDRPDMTWAMTITIDDADIDKFKKGDPIKPLVITKKDPPSKGAGADILRPPVAKPRPLPQPDQIRVEAGVEIKSGQPQGRLPGQEPQPALPKPVEPANPRSHQPEPKRPAAPVNEDERKNEPNPRGRNGDPKPEGSGGRGNNDPRGNDGKKDADKNKKGTIRKWWDKLRGRDN